MILIMQFGDEVINCPFSITCIFFFSIDLSLDFDYARLQLNLTSYV